MVTDDLFAQLVSGCPGYSSAGFLYDAVLCSLMNVMVGAMALLQVVPSGSGSMCSWNMYLSERISISYTAGLLV